MLTPSIMLSSFACFKLYPALKRLFFPFKLKSLIFLPYCFPSTFFQNQIVENDIELQAFLMPLLIPLLIAKSYLLLKWRACMKHQAFKTESLHYLPPMCIFKRRARWNHLITSVNDEKSYLQIQTRNKYHKCFKENDY